ncbi:MAG: hypothetical protein U5J97_04365 [Trueperaceae bacterium]|nr:hypothetical protein [Trueperaceae bacterium]
MKQFPYRPLFFLAALLALGMFAAAVTIPNLFTAGDDIIASEVNDNFSALESAVSALEVKAQPLIATAYSGVFLGTFATTSEFLSVTIDVPAAGVVQVHGTAHMISIHITGTGDSTIRMYVADTSAEANFRNSDRLDVESGFISGQYSDGGSAMLIDEVDAAGSYTYYLNANTFGDNDGSRSIGRILLVATYYPETGGPIATTNSATPKDASLRFSSEWIQRATTHHRPSSLAPMPFTLV